MEVMNKMLPEELLNKGFFESVFNAIQDSICIIKPDSLEIVYANNAFLKETGYNGNDVIGKTCYAVTHHINEPCSGPDHRCPLKELIEDIQKAGLNNGHSIEPIDHIHYKANGEKIYVEVACHPILNGNYESPYIIHITRDITHRKEIEARLLEKSNELLQLNLSLKKRVDEEIKERLRQEDMLLHQTRLASLGNILGDLSHQWKQPLSTISILIQDLEEAYYYEEFNEKYLKEFLKQSLSQIRFMTESIEDFRQFFRPDRTLVRFDVIPAVKEVIRLLDHQLSRQNITVNCDLGNEPIMVEGFLNEFRHVLLNIISNGRDSILQKRSLNPSDTVNDLINISSDFENDQYMIHIDDSGTGIDPENLPMLFHRYFTTKQDNNGTGIGLFMSREMIQEHMKGKLYASNTDKGALFTIVLPRSDISSLIDNGPD
jgi:PAS domain S-box-containing protein